MSNKGGSRLIQTITAINSKLYLPIFLIKKIEGNTMLAKIGDITYHTNMSRIFSHDVLEGLELVYHQTEEGSRSEMYHITDKLFENR